MLLSGRSQHVPSNTVGGWHPVCVRSRPKRLTIAVVDSGLGEQATPPGRGELAVLGVGGVGGMIAARTGGSVSGRRTVAAIRERGLTLVHDGV